MKISAFLLLGFGLFSGVAKAEDKDPRPDMHVMASEISTLEKFMVSEAEFSSSKNESQISGSLSTVNKHLEHLGTTASFANDPSLRVNLLLIRQHMKDAERAFKENNKSFSRYMLQSSLQMCVACHTRKKTADFALPPIDEKNIAPIDLAEYLFATRQFEKGKSIYEGVISGFPGNKAGQWNFRRALLALAVYYARVKEDPKEGEKFFRGVAKMDGIPNYLGKESGAWADEFSAWAKDGSPKLDKLTEVQLLKRAEKLLKNDDLSLVAEMGRSFHVRRLRASTMLHKVLESPGEKSPSKARALLYLGQIYPRISSNLFFRFGDMYLKACITEYPKTAESKSCYVALESAIAEGFTGSAGTDIPEDEQVELMRLKRIAY